MASANLRFNRAKASRSAGAQPASIFSIGRRLAAVIALTVCFPEAVIKACRTR